MKPHRLRRLRDATQIRTRAHGAQARRGFANAIPVGLIRRIRTQQSEKGLAGGRFLPPAAAPADSSVPKLCLSRYATSLKPEHPSLRHPCAAAHLRWARPALPEAQKFTRSARDCRHGRRGTVSGSSPAGDARAPTITRRKRRRDGGPVSRGELTSAMGNRSREDSRRGSPPDLARR